MTGSGSLMAGSELFIEAGFDVVDRTDGSSEASAAPKPTANKAIAALRAAGILHEVSGKRRNRVYTYDAYLKVLSEDTDTQPGSYLMCGQAHS